MGQLQALARGLQALHQLGGAHIEHPVAGVDARGRLHCAGDRFAAVIVTEFPQRHGPALPEPLLNAVREGRELHAVLRRIAAHIRPHGELLAIRVRRRAAIDELTPHQREIDELTAQGLSHKEIAQRVKLSPTTVRNHIANAHRRMGVHNRAALTGLMHRLR